MTKLYLKVMNVSEVISENGSTATANISILQSPSQPMSHMNFNVDVTKDQEDMDFYKSNVGKVFELSFDIKSLTVLETK